MSVLYLLQIFGCDGIVQGKQTVQYRIRNRKGTIWTVVSKPEGATLRRGSRMHIKLYATTFSRRSGFPRGTVANFYPGTTGNL